MDTDDQRDAVTIPARLLAGAGSLLYGDRWQSDFAKTLDLNLRTVQRWAAKARDDQPLQISRALLAEVLGQLERKFTPMQNAFDALRAFHDGDR